MIVTKNLLNPIIKQVAHEIPAPECEAFVELGSKTICDVTEAVSLIKQAQNMYVCLSSLQGKGSRSLITQGHLSLNI